MQLVKKFPAFYGIRRFITALTSVRHLSLSWASPIQSIYPHPTFWRSILILSTHLRLRLPSGLFPSGFPIKTLYTPLLTHRRHMPSPSHSSRFYQIATVRISDISLLEFLTHISTFPASHGRRNLQFALLTLVPYSHNMCVFYRLKHDICISTH